MSPADAIDRLTGDQAADPTVQMLIAQILNLTRELEAEREVSDHWRTRAQQADRRIADLETERFAR